MNKSKKIKRVLAMALAALMVMGAFVSIIPLFVSAADATELSYPISGYDPGVKCPDPVPLLCIVVNFDANENGIDDNADGKNYKRVTDAKDELYGEQWCHFNHDIWYNIIFGEEGQTLMNYYKLMSDGKFYFTPAPETYADADKKGVENDGVVEIVLKGKHLATQDSYVYYFSQAISQVNEYVDFSVFDTNKNGRVDEYELVISFINGGAELAQTPWNWQSQGNYGMEAFRSRAYYRKSDGRTLYNADGYDIGHGGFFTTGSWSYLSERADKATEFAVWAHELGHYLGAPDYYDTDKGNAPDDIGNDFVTSYYSLMGKGCHGGQPSHLDPFTMTSECTGYGFYKAYDVQEDGEYTLYSKTSEKGQYNIIKLNTPNPEEYYLIENRYVSPDYEGEAFDKYNIADKQGILIWHVDEGSFSRSGANNATSKKDPTLAIYATNIKTINRSYGEFPAAFGGSVDVFNPTEYKFPYSQTWYTSTGPKGEAVAEAMKNLRVEVISEPGEEMKIRISGSYKQVLAPEIHLSATDWTQTSVKVTASIKTLNYSTLTSAKLIFSERDSGTVIKEQDITFNSDYKFTADFTGLKPNTAYEYKVIAESSHGQATFKDSNFTKPEPVKLVKITMVINSDQYKTMSQTVNVGSVHQIRGNFTKNGYVLEGWYLDVGYTQKYEPGLIEKEGDFTIYAKWVKAAEKKASPETVTAAVMTAMAAAMPGKDAAALVTNAGVYSQMITAYKAAIK